MAYPKKKFTFTDDFAVYRPVSDDLVVAHKRSCDMGVLPNSFTRGMGRMAGCLGEIAVHKFIKRSKYVGDTTYTHDIEHKKRRVEVKSKSCASIPRKNYMASVNGKREFVPDNDVYFFTRVRKDFMFVWVLGWLPTTKFMQKSVFKQKGESDDDGFIFKSSGFHLPIEDLNKPIDYQ